MKRIILAFALSAPGLQALELHVSPSGSDQGTGASTAPFASIARARDAVRSITSSSGFPSAGIKVWIHGGVYNQPATLVFDERDSGTLQSPIVYASADNEMARVTGAVTLDPTWFALVNEQSAVWPRLDAAAKGQLYSVNLRAHGITDFGSFKARGFGLSATAPMELFVGGRPMTLGRWPNHGETLTRTAAAPSASQVSYSGTRPERWTRATDAWLHGFWAHAWADFHVPLASVNPTAKTLSFAFPPLQYGTDANRPFYAYNLLEEIDQPGEYYIDRAAGVLYYWPAQPLASASLQVSVTEATLVELAGAQNIVFQDVVFEASRGPLVNIRGGSGNRLKRCLLRNAGQFGARVSGTNNGIDQCEILECGEDGVVLEGGDRASLVAGGNFVSNTRVHRVGRVAWTYKPGINLDGGAGNLVTHNLLDDMPHAAILFTGNNHVIEFNEIRRVCQLTSDSGAIYAGRDWGYRGNVIRSNYIHHIESSQEGDGAHGLYLDDCLSGIAVYGNVFYRIANAAVFCGGGRDNIITNNVIAQVGLAHYNDDRGRSMIDNSGGSSWNLLERLSADGVRYQQDPWASAYPAAAAIPNSWAGISSGVWRNPENSVFSRNVGWSNGTWTFERNSTGTGVFALYASLTNNNPSHPALFDENASINRSARPGQLVGGVPGFAPISFGAIGPNASGRPGPSSPPSAPEVAAKASSATQIEVQWTDTSNLAREQEIGFELQLRNTAGAWVVAQTLGADVDFASVTGLSPQTNYAFRVRAFNSLGQSYSNVVTVGTAETPAVAGTATRVEVETSLSVVNDVGGNGSVGTSDGGLDSGESVRLYDAGDAVRVQFTVPAAGRYRVGVRVRAGGANASTGFWPDGYRFMLDGAPVQLIGDATTLSSLDAAYGGCFWGTMRADFTLAAGTHAIEIAATTAWAVADYVEFAPLTKEPGPTDPGPGIPVGTTLRIEAEEAFAVMSDVGGNGSVGVSNGSLDSGQSVRLYDPGDAIALTVNVPLAGNYRLDVRVRSGGTTGAAVFLPSGYAVRLDGSLLPFSGDASSVSALDPEYGGCHWGTMRSASLALSPGPHTVTITATTQWAVVDFVELVALASSTPPSGSAPLLSLPAAMMVEATAATGAAVVFAVPASDDAGHALPASTVPASGTTFPLGTTTVNVTAIDLAGRIATGTFTVTVRDTLIPAITVPANLRVEAVSSAGQPVSFSTFASDAVSGPVTTTNTPATGARFPLGTTTVTARAVDQAGNVATKTFEITISDTTPPVITVPTSVSVPAVGGFGTWVTFASSAVDNIDGIRPTILQPPSGTFLPVGTTTVTATAVDLSGNVATKTFLVSVGASTPAVPTGLIATGGDGEVDLDWLPAAGAARYTVLRALVTGGPYSILSENVIGTSFTDFTVVNGLTYAYVVGAQNAFGSSGLSAQANVTPSARGGEPGWISADIGAVGYGGHATILANFFALWGSGADIWGSYDAFQYVHQTLVAGGGITARVTNLQYTDGWAKAGVMIRETMQPDSKFVAVYLTAGNGVAFQWRDSTGGQCEHVGAAGSPPQWLRLTRASDRFTVEVSANGTLWIQTGTVQVAMNATVFVGLALTSHNNGVLGGATFDQVELAGSSVATLGR